MTASDGDRTLLERFRRGDEAAFEALFSANYAAVFRVAYGLTGARESAEDIVQETFLTLYRRPPTPDQPPRAWLCRVALNLGRNALRGEQRAITRAERAAVADISPDDPSAEAERAEERAEVRAALAALPERQARLLLLRYAGLSYAEIAMALDIAPGSVGTLLARAEQAFAARYDRRIGPTEPSVAEEVRT